MLSTASHKKLMEDLNVIKSGTILYTYYLFGLPHLYSKIMSFEDRNNHLLRLSQVVVNDTIQYKIDKVADVYINSLYYFTVFRRYNSVYEYIIEYSNGDTYLQKDGIIRDSLRAVLCLSEEDSKHMYTMYAFSYKYNSTIDTMTVDIVDRTWSDIAKRCGGVSMNLGGILLDFQQTYDHYHKVDVPQTPPPKKEDPVAPYAPLRPVPIDLVKEEEDSPQNVVIDLALDQEPWFVLVPKGEAVPESRKRERDWICYCEYDNDENEEKEQEEDDEANVTILRSGRRIHKRQAKKPKWY
jgi:hypothetical protein